MIGYGCASSTGTLVHWIQPPVGNLAHAMQDHSKSVSALATLPIAYAYLQQLASMMSFMLESSSHFMGHLHLLLSHCRLSTMAVCYNSQRRFSSHSCTEAFGISSYNGQAFQAQKQRGKLFQTSSNPTRLPARGRVVSRGGERCFDRQRLCTPTSWLKQFH